MDKSKQKPISNRWGVVGMIITPPKKENDQQSKKSK